MAPISLEGLTKDYGDLRAVDGLSFDVHQGEIFGFLGPNGAGKTTTIRTLLGLQSPTAGSGSVLGADIEDEAALVDAKRRLGYLPDSVGFHDDVTGERILEHFAELRGDSRRGELLEIFTPPLERPVREYSTGNRRMLGIVQAFMHDPDLVIMDEPTSGLDPLKQERFNEFLADERDRGTTIFFSSHVLSEVQRVCDRVAILRAGELVTLEDVESLLSRGGKRVRLRLAGDEEFAAIRTDEMIDVEAFEDAVHFTYTGDVRRLVDLLGGVAFEDIDIRDPELEDIFMHYYGADAGGAADV